MRTIRMQAAALLGGMVLGALPGCGSGGGSPAPAPPAESPQKNVLMIVLDDVGTDKLELFDGGSAAPHARTPRMDALAETGIRFTSFYSHPICSVARASIQTGRYPLRTGMGANTEVWELPDSEVLLPELLKLGLPADRAYASAAFGKWHMGRDDAGHAVDNGYDRFYGTLDNTTDHFHWSKVEHDAGSAPVVGIPISEWSPSVVRADALRWIQAQSRPFFAYVAFNPPHLDWQVPPLALVSAATQAELAGTVEGQAGIGDVQRRLFYRAMLEAVDTEIGNLIDGMTPEQRADTLILVVSDNGAPGVVIEPPLDPAHAKPTAYQLAIRVPLIVSGALVPPAPPGGFVCDALVEAVDFWPTLAALAGADAELAFRNSGFSAPYPVIDGASFLPLILDPLALGTKPWVFSELFSPAGVYTEARCLQLHLRAITDGDYKLIRLVNKAPGVGLCAPPVYESELYHLSVDEGETVNLLEGALDPAEQLIFDHLNQQMDLLSEF